TRTRGATMTIETINATSTARLSRTVARLGRILRGLLFALAALVLLAVPAGAQPRAFDIPDVGLVAELPVALAPARTDHIIKLRNVYPPGAVALDVLPRGRESLPGFHSRSRKVKMPAATAGNFTLIVRSRAPGAPRVADIWLDGALVAPKVQFSAGTRVKMPW